MHDPLRRTCTQLPVQWTMPTCDFAPRLMRVRGRGCVASARQRGSLTSAASLVWPETGPTIRRIDQRVPMELATGTRRRIRSVHRLKQSSLRSYQGALSTFLAYITDSAYGWNEHCQELFGTHPTQVLHQWNSATHVQDAGKRAFTKSELQRLFDRADDEVARIRTLRRKGWWAAYRDSVLFKTAYAYGLRINEVRQLETIDFGRNPKATQFEGYGVLRVRHGKAMKGSAPKLGSVLTVFDWSVDVLDEWITDIRPALDYDGLALFPSPRHKPISHSAIQERFRRYCAELDYSPGLDFDSLRRSYVTHLIEDGVAPLRPTPSSPRVRLDHRALHLRIE